jgi:hypothetical protein
MPWMITASGHLPPTRRAPGSRRAPNEEWLTVRDLVEQTGLPERTVRTRVAGWWQSQNTNRIVPRVKRDGLGYQVEKASLGRWEADVPSKVRRFSRRGDTQWAWIYFVRAGEPGRPIKIGFAKDVHSRVADLQVAQPDTLVLLGVMAGGPAIERELHEHFQRLHLRGEWFRSAPELLDYIDARCDGDGCDGARATMR